MSNLARLLRRERLANREVLIGTVVSEVSVRDMDGNASGVWLVKVDIGSNRLIEVPIKSTQGRNYAQLGQTVQLRRTAAGRFAVTGPGGRLTAIATETSYDLSTGSSTGSVDVGFSSEVVAFSYYATLDGGAGLGVLWGDGVTPFNLVRQLDAQGNPV